MALHADLLVIGGGTGGLRTAINAAHHGHSTIVIEPHQLGGTCLNSGCIPTKALLHAAHLYHQAQNLSEFGIKTSQPKIDFPTLMGRVHGIIKEGQDHIKKSVKSLPLLKVVKGHAHFLDATTVQAGDENITADKIIICTGAKSAVPPIKGLELVDYMTSDDVLKLKSLPKSILIVGGGYIAMEFATFFNRLGTKVTIVERNSEILKILDPEVSTLLREAYMDRGVKFVLETDIVEAIQKGGTKTLVTAPLGKKEPTKSYTADALLIATGRVANTGDLKLEAAGIKTGKNGLNIEIDDRLQTSNPNIYALGDCTGKSMFAHSAKRESHVALVNTLEGHNELMDFAGVPWAVFTDPPVAGIGIDENAAKEQGRLIGFKKAAFARAGRAAIVGKTEGFVKVMYDKKDHTILGCTIVGIHADDLIHEFAAVMHSGTPTIDIIEKTIHVHPTISEVMEALKDIEEN